MKWESGHNLSGVPGWIVASVVLFIFALTTGFNGLYGQDSFEYLRYSRALHVFFTTGTYPGTFYWPVLYPLTGALLSFVLPDILSLQIISIVCFGFTYIYLGKIIRILFPLKNKEITMFLLLFFCLSPFILRYSLTVMSEPMALLFITAYFYNFFKFHENRKNRYFTGLVFFGCASIYTRYPSFFIVYIPSIYATYLLFKNFQPAAVISSIIIILVFICGGFLLNDYKPGSLLGRPDFALWSINSYFKRSFITTDGSNTYMFPNLCYILKTFIHPGYIFSGFLLLIMLKKKYLEMDLIKIVLLVIMAYTLFIAGLPFQNDRVLLLTFPLVLILFSGPFLEITRKISQIELPLPSWGGGRGAGNDGGGGRATGNNGGEGRNVANKGGNNLWVKWLITMVILIQLVFFYVAFKPFYRNNQNTRTIALKMLEYPDKKIYTFNIDMALKGYGVKNETVNLWSSRLDYFEPKALVLFNFAETGKQWKGMNPMLNWEDLSRDHHLKVLESLPDGWNLYEITD